MMTIRRAALLACLLVVVSSAAFCDDATMGRYGPMQTGFTAEKLEPPLTLSWEYTANRCKDNPAAPVVADGSLLLRVRGPGLRPGYGNGQPQVEIPDGAGADRHRQGHPGRRRRQALLRHRGCKLYCLNAETGTFEWFFETRGAVRCPPFVDDGILYFGSDDNSIYTINRRDRAIRSGRSRLRRAMTSGSASRSARAWSLAPAWTAMCMASTRAASCAGRSGCRRPR